MNTYTKQKDGTIAVLIRNEWKPATTTRNKHGILQALSADGKQWEDLPAALQDQQARAPSGRPAPDYQKPLGIPFTAGQIPDQVAPFPAYPGTTAQPGIKTTQPETEYQKSMGGLVSAGAKGLGSGFAVEAPRSAISAVSGAERINRSMLARLGYKTDQAKYEQELSQASALPAASARERMVKEGELERLKAGKPEEPIIEKAYNFVQELTEITAERPEFKADLENMTQMERDVYSGLRSLPVSLGAGAAGAVTVAAAGLTGVPLAVGAGVSTLVIMGLSAGEDFVRNWEKQAETDPQLKAIVENLAKEENIPFDEAKQEMFDQMEINKKGVYYGLSEAIPEALGNLVMFWTAGFGKPLAAAVKTGVSSILKTGAKLVGGGAVEIGTELVTGTLQRGIEEKAGLPVEPMEKMLRDTFGSTLIMTIASAGLLKGTNLAMRYNMAEKAGIKPTDAPAAMENIPDIPTTPEAKAQTSQELRRAAAEIKASDPVRAEDIEIIAAFQENISDMSAEERADIVTSMMTRQGRTVAQGIVDKQNKLEQAQADIEKERTTGQTDYLTGINSRRGLEAARTVDHTQAIIFDIDLFKKVNDTFGHPVGDVVLKDAAFRAQGIAQKYGAELGRIGGEEFVLLVPQGQDAAVISEEIRAEMESRPSEAFDKVVPFTVSVGYAPADATGDPWATADKKMYEAKKAGRNRVIGIDQPDGPGPAIEEGEGYVTEGQGQEPVLAAERTPAEIRPPAQTLQQPPAAAGAGEGQAPGGGAVRAAGQIQEITPEDIAILKAGRADLEAVKGVPSKRDQLFRNLERAYIQRHGLPTLGLSESPSVIIPLVDKAINKGKLTDIQTRKVLETVRALRDFNEQVIQNPVPLQEINIGDLEVGDTFNIAGEKFTVKEYKDGEYTIEDGKTYKVDPFEKLNIDEGTLAKEEAITEKTPAGDQAVMGGLAGREMPRGPIRQKPSIATDRGTIFDEEGLKTDREVMAARGQTEMGKSAFVSQAVEAGVDPEVAEATRILGEAFAKATGISVDKVLPQITTEAPGAGMLAQREAQINSPEFKKWFGKSQVVDKDGKPLVVYHATNESFDVFDVDNEMGAHFSVSPAAAAKRGRSVYPVYLSLKNPLKMNDAVTWNQSLYLLHGEMNSGGLLQNTKVNKTALKKDIGWKKETEHEIDPLVIRDALEKQGFDGILYDNGFEGGGVSYISFSPTQIKSATGNRGTFRPNDPNILHQEAQAAEPFYSKLRKAGPAIQGAITFDAGKALIHVLKTANASTLPHELAHNFLKLGTEAKYFNDTEIKAMTDFGVLDKTGTITRPGQEKFARSFERYLRDGQSPSEQLKAIFDKFKAWLQEVYAQLQGSAIDIKLTPEIKGIFDRMLGVPPAEPPKPFTAPPRGEQTPQAAIPPKQGKIAQPAPVMQAPEATQQDITAPKPEPSKIRNFFYGNYGATMPMPVEPLTRKRINKLAILDFVEKNFGVYVRDRATMKFEEGVAGKHYPEQHIIRLKFWGELEPMMHEIGHELNSKLGSVLGENWKKPFSKELGQMDYDKEQLRPEEGFAEFMRKYFTGDPALEDTAPTFYDFFIQAIKNIPPWDTRINGLRDQLETWQQQGSDARFDAMTEPKPPVNLPKMVKSAWRQLYRTWVNAGEPFSHLEEQLETVHIKLKPSESPAHLRTYFNKKTRSKAYAWVFDGQFDPRDPSAKLGPSLSEIIVKTGIKGAAQLKNFVRYGTARRVMERYEAHGLEAGFDVNDAEYVAGKYQNPIWDQALDEITKWNDNLLRLYLLKPGLISEEQLTQIRAMNPMYIPMKRIIDNGERYGIGGSKELEAGSGLKRVKGGSHPVENFLKAMSEQAQGIIARGEKAFIGKALADLAEQKNVAGIITQVAAPIQVTRVSPDRAKISFSKEDAKLAEKKLPETLDYDAVTEALKAQGIDVKAEDLDAILTIFTQAPAYKGKDNIISLWRDGKQKFYEVDNNLYQALQSMDAKFKWPFLDFVRRGAAMFSRGLRLGATGLNASFSLITNPVFRDPFTYAIFSKKPLPTPLDPISTNLLRLGLFGGKTENILRAERSGLGGASFLGMDKNLVYDEIMLRNKNSFGGKTLMVVRHPIEFLKELFSWPEMGPRLTEYDNVYKQSLKDHPDWSAEDHNIFAFNAAQDVTVNFTRGGNASFAINELAAFSNVAIQGPEKMIRAIKENPVGVIAKGVAYLSIMGIINYLSNRDREWYNNLPLAYRYNNMWFEVGDAVFRMPLPFELGSVFIAAPCATMESLRQKRPDDFASLVEIFKAQMPNLLPTITEPMIDIMRNKDWLGNPIEGEGMKYLPVTERKKYYTTEVASALSKGFDKFGMKLSPVQIDYLFNGWTGGIVKNLPKLDIKETADIPIIGKYVLRMPENPRRQLEEFFTAEEVLMQDDAFARAIDTNLTDAEEDRLADIKNFRKSWTKYYAKDLKEYSSAMSTGDKTAHAKLVKTYREIREHLTDIGFK